MSLLTTNHDSGAPLETLYKYLIKAELPRNAFLDELQDKYFAQISLKENDDSIMSQGEESEQSDWELYGNVLIENISQDFEEEHDLDIQLNHETFVGSLDRLGNGFGKIEYVFKQNIIFILSLTKAYLYFQSFR